jgi:hypothetical protein
MERNWRAILIFCGLAFVAASTCSAQETTRTFGASDNIKRVQANGCTSSCYANFATSCPTCSVTCAVGQVAVCSQGQQSISPGFGGTRCAAAPSCRCLGPASSQPAACGSSCSALLVPACSTCSIACPVGKVAVCTQGQQVFHPSGGSVCTNAPNCSCSG